MLKMSYTEINLQTSMVQKNLLRMQLIVSTQSFLCTCDYFFFGWSRVANFY